MTPSKTWHTFLLVLFYKSTLLYFFHHSYVLVCLLLLLDAIYRTSSSVLAEAVRSTGTGSSWGAQTQASCKAVVVTEVTWMFIAAATEASDVTCINCPRSLMNWWAVMYEELRFCLKVWDSARLYEAISWLFGVRVVTFAVSKHDIEAVTKYCSARCKFEVL